MQMAPIFQAHLIVAHPILHFHILAQFKIILYQHVLTQLPLMFKVQKAVQEPQLPAVEVMAAALLV
jgi:hypothetical protein